MSSVYICVWSLYAILRCLLFLQNLGSLWLSCGITLLMILMVAWFCVKCLIKFGIKLVPQRLYTLASYPLTTDEEKQVIYDTRDMDVDQIVDYAMHMTNQTFSYNIYPSKENEASCVGFATMCASVANAGFRANGKEVQAIVVEGTGRVLGIDICKVLGKWLGPMFGGHVFVQIVSSNGIYSIDPTVKALFGYDLKTWQRINTL